MSNPLRSLLVVLLLAAGRTLAAEATALANPNPARFEKEIAAYEAADRTNPPPQHAILFYGSSSIRIWRDLAKDFPDKPVINRGFGGSHISDCIAFADRIVIPYHPRQIVFYAGDNDLAAGKSPERVAADFRQFVTQVRAKLPEVSLVFISCKPSPSRWRFADQYRAANRLVKAYCQETPWLKFVDVFAPMLGQDGKPRKELFLQDELHMNRRGYAIWIKVLTPVLQ